MRTRKHVRDLPHPRALRRRRPLRRLPAPAPSRLPTSHARASRFSHHAPCRSPSHLEPACAFCARQHRPSAQLSWPGKPARPKLPCRGVHYPRLCRRRSRSQKRRQFRLERSSFRRDQVLSDPHQVSFRMTQDVCRGSSIPRDAIYGRGERPKLLWSAEGKLLINNPIK